MEVDTIEIQDKETYQQRDTSSCTGKARRRRTVYSQAHMQILLDTFHKNPYPGITMRERLSQLTGVHESRIQVWFQNRRARKNRKKKQEIKNQNQTKEQHQYNSASKISQTTQPRKTVNSMGNYDNQELTYKGCHVASYPHSYNCMSTTMEPQLPLGQTKSFQTPNLLASVGPSRSAMASAHHLFTHAGSSGPLASSNNSWQSSVSDCNLPVVSSSHGLKQECSLEQMLEEFQSCWTEVANSFPAAVDDLCYLL